MSKLISGSGFSRAEAERADAYYLEFLEPRMLLSAGPVDAPVEDSGSSEVTDATAGSDPHAQTEHVAIEDTGGDSGQADSAENADYFYGETEALEGEGGPVETGVVPQLPEAETEVKQEAAAAAAATAAAELPEPASVLPEASVDEGTGELGDPTLEQLVETLRAANAPPAGDQTSEAPYLPHLSLVDPDTSVLAGQLVYLDRAGAEGLIYDGPVRFEAGDLSAYQAPAALAGLEGEIFSGLLQKLNEQFAGVGVSFTTERPESGDHSTVYLGGDGSAFRDYGIFYGVAERVDVGNTDRSDRAFVFTDNLAGVSNSLSGYVDLLAGFVAHETGRLLGYANELTPTLELLESHPLLAVAAAPLPETLVNLSQPLDEPSPGAPSAAATQNDGTTGVSGEYDEEMIGEHIDFTITFDNIGTSEGYAPYIDFTAESGITFARQVNEFTGEVTIADSAAVLLGEEIGSDIQLLGKIVEVAVLVDEVQAAADAWLAARVADPIVAAYLTDHGVAAPASYDFAVRVFDSVTPENVENFLFNSNLSAAYQALVNLRDNGEVTNSSPVLGSIPDDSIDNTGDTVGADDPDLIPNQVQYFNQTTSDFLTPEGAPAGAVAKFWVPPTFTVPSTNFHNLNLSSFVTLRLDHPLTGASLSADGTAAPGSALTAGLSHGDIYYTMELPFGSYTPGQPEALIDFEARLAPEDGAAVFHNQDNASDDRADYELSVRALGGFRLGADPNDNPDEDPLVAGNPSADSVVPQVVELVKDGPETVIQQGPSYPNIYSLFVDVAAGETLEDLLIEDFLPGTVVYVPNSITVQYRTGSEAGILRVNQPGSDNIYSDIVAGTSTAITGSVAVTQGSAAVVGTGTSFTSALAVDDLLTIGAQTFTVNAIADDTNLTLSSNYLGISGAGLSGFVSPGGYSESLLEDFLTNDTPNGPGGTLELYWQSFTAVDNINADGDYDSSLENDFNWNFGDGLTGGEFTGSNATGQNHPRIEERLRNRDWDIYITYEAYAPEFDALGNPTGGEEADNDAVLTAVHNGNAVADNDNFENGHDDERLDSDWSDIVGARIGTGKAITNTFDSNGNPVEPRRVRRPGRPRRHHRVHAVDGDERLQSPSTTSSWRTSSPTARSTSRMVPCSSAATRSRGFPPSSPTSRCARKASVTTRSTSAPMTRIPVTPTAYVPLGSPVVVEDIVWDTVDNRWEDGAGNPIDNIGGYTAALDPDASPATGTSSGADYLTWALSRELAPGRTGVFVNGLAGGERLVNGQDETFYDAGHWRGNLQWWNRRCLPGRRSAHPA